MGGTEAPPPTAAGPTKAGPDIEMTNGDVRGRPGRRTVEERQRAVLELLAGTISRRRRVIVQSPVRSASMKITWRIFRFDVRFFASVFQSIRVNTTRVFRIDTKYGMTRRA